MSDPAQVLGGDYRMYLGVDQSEAEAELDLWRDWLASLTEAERRDLADYQGLSEYLPFSQARLSDADIDSGVLRRVQRIDAALRRARVSEHLVVWRGRRSERAREPFAAWRPGNTVSVPGFASCTLIERVAVAHTWVGPDATWDLDNDPTTPVLFEFLLPRDSLAGYAQPLQREDKVKPEAEILLPRNQQFLVIAVEETERTRSPDGWRCLDDPSQARPVRRIQAVAAEGLAHHEAGLRPPSEWA